MLVSNLGYTLLLIITRKPELTPAEFKEHWDTTHVALQKEILGPNFPLSHTRRYIPRTEVNGTWAPTVIVGPAEEVTYDGIAELVFEDEAAFNTWYSIQNEPENAARIAADEEQFIVREKTIAMISEASVATRD